jgi:hypothetical protein
MQPSHSSDVANCAVTQELPSISRIPNVHYSVHKIPLLLPILSQMSPVHTTPSYLRPVLILYYHLGIGLPSGLFPSG